ncbi:MAG: ribosome assembly factor SBDS [Candidatus Woesearchaeota archaeon]
MPGQMIFDKEKIHINMAKLKKDDQVFEIVIDPENAIKFRIKEINDVRECLKSERIFLDAKKGIVAPESDLLKIFNTKDTLKIAEKIIREGEIQLTTEQREKMKEEKRKKIINLIHINAIDPTNGLPHPITRIENAFLEAKIHIDQFKKAEDQVNDIVKQLRSILPIKFAVKEIELHIPANYAVKLYGIVKNYGKILKEEWMNDGSWNAVIEIPAGLQTEFFDELNSKTHGNIEIKILKEK